MKKILIILILTVIVLMSGCVKNIPQYKLVGCTKDSNCVVVSDVGCCKCPRAINEEYQDYWKELDSRTKEDCSDIVCELCGPSEPIGSKCEKNICQLVY